MKKCVYQAVGDGDMEHLMMAAAVDLVVLGLGVAEHALVAIVQQLSIGDRISTELHVKCGTIKIYKFFKKEKC